MNAGILVFGAIAAVLLVIAWRDRSPGNWLDRTWSLNGILRAALAVWALAYPVVACAPLLITGTDTAGGTAVGGLVSLAVGATLFGPWIVGLLVLGVLAWVTK